MKLKQRLLSAAVSAVIAFTAVPFGALAASADDANGKYISEVFIAYGKTEADATNWLTSHGWEPVGKDLNAGKLSYWDDNDDDKVAAVMGIKRTNDPNEAVTDMAVMNMKGGYDFNDYNMLVEQKQTEINAFVDKFVPVLREYRDNYTGKGSAAGKARADMAHDLLNKFYDGEIDGEYAVNDTGKPLGDLLLKQTSRELGDAYAGMSRNDKLEHVDITQMLLESSGPAALAIEQTLVLAADTTEDTWLERLTELSGTDLADVIEDYIPSAKGKRLTGSAAETLLQSTFGDEAEMLAAGYETVQQDLIWYEAYMSNNNLWQKDNESDADYAARISAHFDALKAKDEAYYNDTIDQYYNSSAMYYLLYDTEYEGEWGETLGDFFNPEDGTDYGEDPDNFLPFAAVLSEGQRAGLEFLSLYSLLQIGDGTEEATKKALPDVQELFKNAKTISVYSGINRAIFRGGVALTSKARMQQSMGKGGMEASSVFMDDSWLDIVKLSFLVIGVPLFIDSAHKVSILKTNVEYYSDMFDYYDGMLKNPPDVVANANAEKSLTTAQAKLTKYESALTTQYVFLGIGIAMILIAAGIQIYDLVKFYDVDFTPIPMMIVDEADIVTYMTDEKGNAILDEKGKQKKNIEFDQFAYYEVVKCNRQEVGQIGDWQDGVSKYKENGCGDAADLNCDCGKQWLALYTNKSPAKGNPILADSLTYQTGSSKAPLRDAKALHLFTYDFAMNIADEAYSYNDKNGGIYLFWQEDKDAYNTASSFSTGQLALAGVGGLAVGILGATIVTTLGKKKKETPEVPTAA